MDRSIFKDTCDFFLKNLKVATINQDNVVTNNPFFISASLDGNNLQQNISDIDKKYINTFSNLPIELRILYSNLGNNSEASFSKLIFLSLIEIHDRIKNYEKFYDIALIHIGMGHVIVLSYFPEKNMYFFRPDGGSNYYEREAYLEFYKNYNPNDEKEESFCFLDEIKLHKLLKFNELKETLILFKNKNSDNS